MPPGRDTNTFGEHLADRAKTLSFKLWRFYTWQILRSQEKTLLLSSPLLPWRLPDQANPSFFTSGAVPPHKLTLPLSSNILGHAGGQQEAKNWWCLLTFPAFLLPPRLRLSSARCFTLAACRGTNTVPGLTCMAAELCSIPLCPVTSGPWTSSPRGGDVLSWLLLKSFPSYCHKK